MINNVTIPPFYVLGGLGKSASSFSNFMRGDDKGMDWRWGLLGPTMATLPVGIGSKIYAKHLMPAIASNPANAAERKMFRDLKTAAKAEGVNVVNAAKSWQQRGQDKKAEALRKLLGIELEAKPVGSHYNPVYKEIGIAKGQKNPAILGHELGHARGGKCLMGANVAGKLGISQAALWSLLQRNEDTGAKIALAGTGLFGGSLLASELDASRRGYKALRGLGAGRKAALKSFVGIPTYAAYTAVPWLAHKTKKFFGGYDESLREN